MEQNKIEQCIDYLQDLSDSELLEVFMTYVEHHSYYEDYIYPMAMFDELMEGKSYTEVVEDASNSSFNISDNYFKIGIYGLESYDNVEDFLTDDWYSLANDIIEYDYKYNFRYMEDLFESWEDDTLDD